MGKQHFTHFFGKGRLSKAIADGSRFRLETLEDRSTPAALVGQGMLTAIDNPTGSTDSGQSKFGNDIGPLSVFGTDDRILVTDTTIAPYRNIVQLRMTFPNSSEEWIGSGSIVDSYHVLTAGHNLYDASLGGWASSIEVIAARNDAYLPFGVANVIYKRTFDTFINTGDQDYDMGLLTLDRRLGNFTGAWTVGSWSDSQLNTTLNVAGYPVEIASGNKMYRASGPLASLDSDMLYYNGTLDTSGGMSGSPIWATNPSTGVRTQVGVHVAGAPSGGDSNAGVRITSTKWGFFADAMSADNSSRPPIDKADFIDYDFWFGTATSYTSTSSINSGASFSITSKLFNIGTAASGGYTVSYYASYDKIIDATDMYIGSTTSGALAPFTAVDVTWSGAFPQLAPGQAYIGWKIDALNGVNESSEANNNGVIGAAREAINQIGDVTDTIAGSLNVGMNPVLGNFSISRYIGDGSSSDRDVDMYSFQGAAGVRISAITSLPNGGANLDSYLRLFSSNGTQLAFDDNSAGGTYARIDYTLPANSVYYLGVSGASNKNYNPSVAGSGVISETGNYKLALSLLDITTADVGDTIATAQAVNLATAGGTFSTVQRVGNGANGGKDVDLYKVTVIAGSTLTAIAKLPPSGFPVDTYFRVFDSAGTQLASDDDSANDLHFSYVQYTFANAGTYYLGVSGYGNTGYNPSTGTGTTVGDAGEYQLVVNLLTPAMRADIVGRTSAGQWWLARSNGSNFTNQYWGSWSSGTWSDSSTGDFDGDGKLDIVGRNSTGQWWVGISNGSSFSNQLWGAWSTVNWQDVRVADFNGDGRADIAGRYAGQWWLAVSTGSAFANRFWGAWSDTTWLDVKAADFDGDGKADIAGRLTNGDWWVAHANASSFTNQYYGRWSSVTWNDVRTGDFNGDGSADISGRLDNGQVWVGLSLGNGFTNQMWGQWSSSLHWNDILTGDFNDDGRTDLAARCDCGNWYVSISTGESFFQTNWVAWSKVTWLDVTAGDFNGDGKTDIAGRLDNGQWWIAISSGVKFANQYWGAWTPSAGWTAVSAGAFTGVQSTIGGTGSRPVSRQVRESGAVAMTPVNKDTSPTNGSTSTGTTDSGRSSPPHFASRSTNLGRHSLDAYFEEA